VKAADIKKALDDGSRILRERDRPPEKKSSQIRLSNALACVRKLYMLETGMAVEQDLSAETLRIFELGTARGATIAEALIVGMEGWEARAEATVILNVAGYDVPGHVDLLLERKGPDGRERTLVEVKTMNPYAWKLVREDDALTVSDQYRAQIGCYWEALGQPEDVFLIAENKATSEHKIVPFGGAALEAGYVAGCSNLKQAIEAIRDKMIPERPFGPNEKGELPWQCGYCSVWEQCWDGQVEQVPGKKKLRMVKA